ncbi:hypothetical protein QFZ41_003232 [Luteibacter sp. W1I16]
MPASGPQLSAFRSGWAFPIFAGNKGHYFRRIGLNELAMSVCGLVYPVANLYGIGTFLVCRICRRRLAPRLTSAHSSTPCRRRSWPVALWHK